MAKPFPLEAVLRLRQMEEEAKMKELASFDRIYLREQDNLTALHESLYRNRTDMDERTAGAGISSQESQLYLSFFAAQSSRIRFQEDLVEKVRLELERKKREMGFVINRRKIFDNLKEKHIENEERREMRLEAQEIDDIASMRFAMRSKGIASSA